MGKILRRISLPLRSRGLLMCLSVITLFFQKEEKGDGCRCAVTSLCALLQRAQAGGYKSTYGPFGSLAHEHYQGERVGFP